MWMWQIISILKGHYCELQVLPASWFFFFFHEDVLHYHLKQDPLVFSDLLMKEYVVLASESLIISQHKCRKVVILVLITQWWLVFSFWKRCELRLPWALYWWFNCSDNLTWKVTTIRGQHCSSFLAGNQREQGYKHAWQGSSRWRQCHPPQGSLFPSPFRRMVDIHMNKWSCIWNVNAEIL